jgi:hypothetical protein
MGSIAFRCKPLGTAERGRPPLSRRGRNFFGIGTLSALVCPCLTSTALTHAASRPPLFKTFHLVRRLFMAAATLMTASTAPTSALAQWLTDGVPLVTASGFQGAAKMIPDGAGGAIVVWQDDRSGQYDIYVQRLDAAGVRQWGPANGLPLCTAAGQQGRPMIVADGAGGAIVTWEDARSGSNVVYAQRVNGAGMPQWAANGVQVCNTCNSALSPVIAADGAGGATIAWTDFRSGVDRDVYAQRLNAAGLPQWTANGVGLCTGTGNMFELSILGDGTGGATLTWSDNRTGNFDVYTQRVSGSGAPQWTVDGVVLCNAANDQFSPEIVTDATGGAIVTWEDRRSLTGDVYAQRVNASGVPQWTPNGVALCNASNAQVDPKILADGAGGAFVTWEDARSGSRVYAQRVNATGAALWTANGVAVCPAGGVQSAPRIASDGSGGAIVSWDDVRSGHADIYAQRVNTAGVAQWAAAGVPLCTASGDQYNPEVVPDGSGGAIVLWDDGRTGSPTAADVYAQRVTSLGCHFGSVLAVAPNDQSSPSAVADGSGGAIIAWQDNRGGGYDLYVQRVNGAGAAQWAAHGVALCTASGNQFAPVVVGDGVGGAIVSWHDNRSGNYDIYAQRVNAAGVAQWATDGVALCAAGGDQSYPQIVADGSGGAIVTWAHGFSDIHAQRVDASGTPQWTANGVALCTAPGDQYAPQIVSDRVGGAIVTWHDSRSGNVDLYAQRVSAAGVLLWDPTGVALCTAATSQTNAKILADGAGGAIVAWEDFRSGNFDIYAQRVSAGGTAQWTANGVVLCSAASHQELPTLTADGAGGAIVTWADRRAGAYDIYAQRVSATGATQWIANGVALCTAVGHQVTPAIAPDGAGGALVTWRDRRGATHQVYAQRVNSGGVPQWAADGVALCGVAGKEQYDPRIVVDGAGGAFVVWTDDPGIAVSDLYLARIPGSGIVVAVGPESTIERATLRAWPNPFFRSVAIELALMEDRPVRLEVFDVTGRRVWSRPEQLLSAGKHRLEWHGETDDGTPPSAGIYFLRVLGSGFTVSSKPLVLVR